MIKKIVIICFFILFSQPLFAKNSQEIKLNKLFNKLKNISNFSEAKKIESKIWKLWITHPTEKSLTELLAKGSDYMFQNQYASAHNVFSKVIELDPNWAEGWNKRATVLYLMGNYELSQKDIDMVLSLEKRHFGALSGQGLVQTALQNYQKAIDSYIEAHKVYPSMETPLIMIEKLKLLIKKQSI
tara:strand:- start:299 stop:853 length:555 start_codon:yes stop_codon:yes gene_type:complete